MKFMNTGMLLVNLRIRLSIDGVPMTRVNCGVMLDDHFSSIALHLTVMA